MNSKPKISLSKRVARETKRVARQVKGVAGRLHSSVKHLMPRPASQTPPVLENEGYCPCCSSKTVFRSHSSWLRDNYFCERCRCIPRERALMWTIETFFPQWKNAVIHESSPIGRGASVRISRECANYIPTQYFPDAPPGTMVNGVRCENLEAMSFKDASVDLHITQDVFEHIFEPEAAFREIARTLRPGGAHIFTVPLLEKERETIKCAALVNGKVIHYRKPEYHGNPVSEDGALVTTRWGYDICDFIASKTGLFTRIVYIDALEHGIRAELNEVLVTRKPAVLTAQGS